MAFDPSGLSSEQKAELKQDLETKLNALNRDIEELERELTQEDDEKAAADEVDRSSYEEEMQRLQNILDGKSELRFEVRDAITRIEDGAYGVCEESEEPIGFKRLKAQPWTRYSLESQKELESRGKAKISGGRGFPSGFSADQ